MAEGTMHILLASRNRHKIRELEDILAADISGVAVHSLDEVGFAGDIDDQSARGARCGIAGGAS